MSVTIRVPLLALLLALSVAVPSTGMSIRAADAPPAPPAPTAPADDVLEGTVIEISGPASVHIGEAYSGKVAFAQVTRPHQLVIRWVDTKGRICEQVTQPFAQPTATVSFKFALANPIGCNHRIEALVDGKLQSVSASFSIQFPYAPWVDYKACVWAHYDQAFVAQERAAGLNGSIYTGRATTDIDFSFYPDNICYEVFSYYHKRRDEDTAMREAWFKSPNTATLFHRRPSLTDEGTWDKVKDRLLRVVEEVKGYRPIFYNVADEIGIGDQSEPTDLDWEYSSRDAWRSYLERKYGTLDALNAEWGTTYASWGAVRSFFPQTDAMYYQLWRDCLLPNSFETVEKFNAKFGTQYKSFAEVVNGYKAICTDDAGMKLEGLKANYKKLDELNQALGTAFESHEKAAQYITDFEAWGKQQNAADTRRWNLAFWCDFRDYMDEYMAGGLKRACDIGRAADPGGRFGITGTHHPGVFNGHNYEKILPGIDAIIPYDIGQSFELIRGLNPNFCFMHPTWATGNKLKRDLWYYFLHGCRGVLIWDNDEPENRLISKATGALTERGLSSGPALKEITSGTDRLLLQSHREDNGIAIYHSQASIRVNWWHNYVNVGRRWMLRHSWDEYGQDECGVLRTSWIKLLEDNHLQFVFVSPDQVAQGRLAKDNIKLLVLPEVWALSDQEARNIEAFVAAGGTAIADQNLGVYDEHGRRRDRGVLDAFFGVDQSVIWGDRRKDPAPAAEAAITAHADLGGLFHKGDAVSDLATTATPVKGLPLARNSGAKALAGSGQAAALVVRSDRWKREDPKFAEVTYADAMQPATPIKGETIFLNLDVSHYSQTRMINPDKTEKILAVLRELLPPSIQPAARVVNGVTGKRQPGTEVGVWDAGANRRTIAVWHNIQLHKEGIGGEAYVDNSIFEKEEQVQVLLDREAYAVDQRTGKEFGKTAAVGLTLTAWEPLLLTVQDTPFVKPVVVGTTAAAPGTRVSLNITGDGKLPGGLQVFRVDATDPTGAAVWYYTKKLSTRDGAAVYDIPLALNEKTGTWKFKITDVSTQAAVEWSVEVK